MKILLVCSSGASSGFIARNIRLAAAARGFEIELDARGDSAIDDYINDIDLLLVAPHLGFIYDDLKEVAEEHNVKIAMIPSESYGTMDGNAIVDFIQEITE